jgi:putative ABC transport system substrate-binding protein
MRRREFIALLCSAAASPLAAARGQQPARVPRIGILSDYSPLVAAKSVEPFVRELRDLGYIEGQNIAFEYRHGGGDNQILPRLAAELVRLQPEIILAVGTSAALAAKGATPTIPIVFARVADPIGAGLVAVLSRPGGNLTGVSVLTIDTSAKRLELLLMAVPHAKRVDVFFDPSSSVGDREFREIEEAARSLNLELVRVEAHAPDDWEPTLQALVERRGGPLIVLDSVAFFEHLRRVADLTAKFRLSAMFYRREFVEAGGLMSYGTDYRDNYRRAAAYVDKILKGAKPTDIPVEQPTKFELVINLKTAKALGMEVPPMLLARADEVIE